MARRLLLVDVIEAKNLIAYEKSGTSDPYVSGYLLDIAAREIKNEKYKTHHKNRSLNPKWEHRMTFGQTYDLNNVDALPTLVLKVMHKASTFGTDQPMGILEIPLDSLNPQGTAALDQWYPLQQTGRMKDVAGEIHLSLRFSGPPMTDSVEDGLGGGKDRASNAGGSDALLPDDTENPDYAHESPNELKITLVRGRNLLIKDNNLFGQGGSSDPLAKVKVSGSKTQRTKTIYKNLNPVWQETFTFPDVTDPSLSVEIIIEDEDPIRNDFMGKCIIPLNAYANKKAVKKMFKLRDEAGNIDNQPRGEIEVIVWWRFNIELKLKERPTSVLDSLKKGVNAVSNAVGLDSDEDEAADDEGDEPVEEPVLSDAEAEKQRKQKEEAEAALKKELGDIEVKSGDYQVQVHIIECRELAGLDGDGLSDPVAVVECFGQKFSTQVLPKALNCVFDELFIFNIRNLDKEKFQEGIISIKVNNANYLQRTQLIGSYVFDACSVYFQKDHEMYRKWVALTNDEDPALTGVQGYLKCSVQIVGPGDKLKIHNEQEEIAKERQLEKSSGMASLCLMPPSIKKEWKYLVTTIYRAEYLPVMDMHLGSKGTDAFVQVEYGTAKRMRTKVRTCKGERNAMNPRFFSEIWVPVSTPTMVQTIKTSIWDNDAAANELIATFYSKYSAIEKMTRQSTGIRWVNLYGAPESLGVTVKNLVSGIATQVGNIVGEDMKLTYNTFPEQASNFKGRLLVMQSIQTQRPKAFDTKFGEKIEPFRRAAKKISPMQEPPVKTYVLRAIVASGTEMPSGLLSSKYQVRISCGQYEAITKFAANNAGLCEWGEMLHTEHFDAPVDISQLPDVCIHLCKGEGKDMLPICFARIPAEEVIQTNFMDKAKWIILKEDKSLNALDTGVYPGQLLIRLGLGDPAIATSTERNWLDSMSRLKTRTPYCVRAHVYQGADLPASDSNGLIDPLIKVTFMGKFKETKHVEKNRYPLYYRTFGFDVQLPDIEFAPQVNFQLFDADMGGLQRQYMGNFSFNLQEGFMLKDLSDPLPDPVWKNFFFERPGDGQGRLLVSVQLIPKPSPDFEPPRPHHLTPEKRDAWIEIIALGMRNMAPFNFQAITNPFLEIELDSFGKKEVISTECSKKPSPDNPNFLQRLIMPVKLPDNALFATPLHLNARDSRLGGYLKPVVGVGIIELTDKIPWSHTYVPPQSDAFFSNPLDQAGGYQAKSKKEIEELMAGQGMREAMDEAGREVANIRELRQSRADQDDHVMTQEPLSIDKYIESRINADDTGAGVFGALAHVELPQYGGFKKKALMEDFFAAVDFDEEEEEEGPPKYMKNRAAHDTELEDVLKTTPFETYPLTRGQVNGVFGSTLKVVGKFKGLIRVMLSPDEPPLIDLNSLLKPAGYKVRLYLLKAAGLTAMDIGIAGRPGKSDPYVRVTLGKHVFDDRENAIDDTTDVDLYKLVEVNAELPGSSQLMIEVMDKDDIGSDDLIGKTTIDLEDRWFDKRWQELGRENRVSATDDPSAIRWDTKPIEVRALYAPTSNNAQGMLHCWLDILTPAEAGAYPPDDIALPPKQIFEMRVVVWKCKDVPAQDLLGGQNMTDMYVQVRPEGCKEQQTDTHWRAKKGKGSFNWRMLFDVELGHNTRAMKFPHLSLQIWDRDLLKYNDCICESTFDMRKYYEKAYRKNVAIKLFETKKGAQLQRARERAARERLYAIPDTEEDIPPEEDEEDVNPLLTSEQNSTAVNSADPISRSVVVRPSAERDSDDEMDGDTGVGVMGLKAGEDEASRLAEEARQETAAREARRLEAARRKREEEKAKKSAPVGEGAPADQSKDQQPLLGPGSETGSQDGTEGEEESGATTKDADTEEMMDMITNIKNMTGLWDIDPPDSQWIHMDRLNHETGTREPMGSMCISIQLWPKDRAVVMPAGAARTEPNTDPFLPPPVGRMKFSWNPFVMMLEICGPSLMTKFICCVLCLGILALLIFCQPVLNVLIALFV